MECTFVKISKMKKKLSVTIGIPAYNEEVNIKLLLNNLLLQNRTIWRLEKIIVVSDRSTDKTDEIVRSFRRPIILYKNKKREGTALSQNKILKKNKSDILILLNADVLPKGRNFINRLIKGFTRQEKIGIIGAKTEPLKAKTIFERIINYSVQVKTSLYEQINKGNNLYLCHGRARAFSKEFINKFKWKPTLGEDAYSYLACLMRGFKFVYEPNALILYRSPQNLSDHMKQSVRFLKGNNSEKKYFKSSIVKKEYYIPKILLIKVIFKYFIKNPLYSLAYSLIFICVLAKTFFNEKVDMLWDMSTTSKNLE